ncbi:hypothetical protein [Psychrobacter celer]|uniref:hypothetical protein n=1 Tax=Psychrobacter celer TaxID=306572 RepID=UPI003FCF3776
MNFAQPLGTQHASKIYTSSAFKSITFLHSANYSYAKTAEYIKLNIDTDESPTYRTVEKWLSEADKGDFS